VSARPADGRDHVPVGVDGHPNVLVAEPLGELVFTRSVGTRVDRRNIYNNVFGPAAKRAGLPRGVNA
jgi:hypothetical protein